MYRRILVPLEHSPADEAILVHVRALASRLGSSVVLLHVADRAYLETVCGRLQAEGLDADAVLAAGEPAKEIAAAAEREGCDLIAMATHGHRLLGDVVKGSTATALRHATKIPILMVRQ